VFQINDIGEGHALKYVGLELLQKYDLISKYKVTYHLGQLSLVELGWRSVLKVYWPVGAKITVFV